MCISYTSLTNFQVTANLQNRMLMSMKRLLSVGLTLICLCSSLTLLAQDRVVTGKVTDSKDGSAVVGCLANCRPEAAAALVRYGAKLNLEGAAGTGALDVVKSYFDKAGKIER